MGEKRFTMEYSFVDEEYVFFDGDVALTPSETAKLLNEQQATIEHLTVEKFKENKRFTKLLSEQQATIKSKDKQLERLYNYFQDYLKDEMSGNAFSEMWDFVKEDERWEDE